MAKARYVTIETVINLGKGRTRTVTQTVERKVLPAVLAKLQEREPMWKHTVLRPGWK